MHGHGDRREHGRETVLVVGAGIGGLSAAVRLAAAGFDVTVLEKAQAPGGKMREVMAGGQPVDSGPTVFTLRHVFDELFEAAGQRLDDHVRLVPAEVLARHHWPDGAALDLFADQDRSADAIAAAFGSRNAEGFRRFAADGTRIYRTLEHIFMKGQKTNPVGLTVRIGLTRAHALARIGTHTTLWRSLGTYFPDVRLRQLFGRYATYTGSDPFRAPGVLALIAAVELEGVWLVEGGMHRLARAIEALGRASGADFRYGACVSAIETAGGRASGVRLATGERLAADHLVFAGDPGALAGGLLGPHARRAVPALNPRARSLSAVTLSMLADARGFPLTRHTVFFSGDYAAEFRDLREGRLPADPTIYICAEDRGAGAGEALAGPERMLAIMNAPANGDRVTLSDEEKIRCANRIFGALDAHGFRLDRQATPAVITTPSDFASLFPGSGGAIYGRATHGPFASFLRPGARSRIPGLWLAGGGAHPGAGVPMVALSGKLAADALIADRASTRAFHPAATPGGMSMPSLTTGAMALPSSPSSARSSPHGITGPAGATPRTM
jgi:1-hydroxycarotenoid 3,4-desaturase